MELYIVPAASIACVLVGVWLLKLAAGWWKKAGASETWPSTPGKVTKCKLHVSNAARTSIGPDVSVIYEYSVGSKKFESDRLAFYEITTTKEASEFAERFGKGADVNVFYNPDNYQESVLVRGRRPDKPFHEFVMAALVTVVGVVLAYFHWEKFQIIFSLLEAKL